MTQQWLPPWASDAESLREAIQRDYLADEEVLLRQLASAAELGEQGRRRAQGQARRWIEEIRQQRGRDVNSLLSAMPLSSSAGRALMSLAEALLRVPDAATADALIADKLHRGDWRGQLHAAASPDIKLALYGLMWASHCLNRRPPATLLGSQLAALQRQSIRRCIGLAVTLIGRQFVLANSIEQGLKRARKLESRGFRYSYDMLGEGARTQADAERYFQYYQGAIKAIASGLERRAASVNVLANPGISIKLSALHPRYHLAHHRALHNELLPRLVQLARLARRANIPLTVDAEESARLDVSLALIEACYLDPETKGWQGMGFAVQAYQKRAPAVIEWAADLAERGGRPLHIRLVKGAYWDSEVKQAQQEGLAEYPVFSRKSATDASYIACAKRLLGSPGLFAQFATHNAYTVATVMELAGEARDFEFQRWHGMGHALYQQVLRQTAIPCRIYSPVGAYRDLLAYLVRRLLENGANSSFVNAMHQPAYSLDSLLADPAERLRASRCSRHPDIPLPANLYGAGRANSQGVALSDIGALRALQTGLGQQLPRLLSTRQGAMRVRNPADTREIVGAVDHHKPEQMRAKVAAAQAALADWAGRAATERAQILREIASALQAHRDVLILLCIKEAGRSIADSQAELREAIDFCHYYAQQCLREDAAATAPRGVVLCISPWNFPLAIFIGQIAAALAAGNTVVAKAAPQTALIAQQAVTIMLAAGLPRDCVQLVLAPGLDAGEVLADEAAIRAVLFTGSCATAGWLNRRLAARPDAPIALVAETGGLNAMIVDSSALLEQVTDDVIRSGFHSAGQRCSSLRLLYVQDDIAEALITMLSGAMACLKIGDPAELATDVGPLIDAEAVGRLNAHVDSLQGRARLLYCCELPERCQHGHFFAPRLYEIDDPAMIREEVFGPIVHLIRFSSTQLRGGGQPLLEAIHASGFGLTLGIHSRIQGRAARIAERARVGNVYINRDMVGAVVGVQPFGGRGRSGTGPKAGGPHYLPRLRQCALSADGIAPYSAQLSASQPEGFADGSHEAEIVACVATFIAQQRDNTFSDHCLNWCRWLLAQAPQWRRAVDLPGPTGESNQLYAEPRGQLLAMYRAGDSAAHALLSMVVSLLSGNHLKTYLPAEWLALFTPLATALQPFARGEQLLQLCAYPADQPLAAILGAPGLRGVIAPPDSALRGEICRLLAQREGEIARFICETIGPHYWQRFIEEKTVTDNLSAAGGNAFLLNLADP